MNKIQKVFSNRQAFVGYITGGYGGIERSVEAAIALVEGGVDILEIGLPFSDPIADGPVIQKACEQSLNNGTTPEMINEIAKRIKQKVDVPLVLFSYYNPLLKKGDSYLQQCKEAGFDAVLVVDLPMHLPGDEAKKHLFSMQKANLEPIFVVTPSTSNERIIKISAANPAFLYYACRKGTTGMKSSLPDDFGDQMKRVRSCTNLPIVAGFGIADRHSASQVLTQECNGFVVGSAFVDLMAKKSSTKELKQCAMNIDPRGIK